MKQFTNMCGEINFMVATYIRI